MPVPPPPPAALVEEELNRLIDSDAMRRAPSHTRLLRYLVERCVAGDGAALRETSIALEVFRRDPRRRTTPDRSDRARHDAPAARAPRSALRALRAAAEGPHRAAQRTLRARVRRGGRAAATQWRGRPAHAQCDRRPAARRALRRVRRSARGRIARLGVPRYHRARLGRPGGAAGRHAGGARRAARGRVGGRFARGARADGQLRLTVRLLDAADASVQWVETRTQPAEQRFAMLDAITDRVFARFAARLRGDGSAPESAALAELLG